MYCENCGVELQDPNQRYCPNCGIPLKIKGFKYSVREHEFRPFKIKIPIYEILDSDFIILIVDPFLYRVWIWCGSNTTTRMRYIATKLARNKYGKGFKIVPIEEGSEPLEFKIMLKKKPNNQDTKVKSMNEIAINRIFEYNGATEEFDELELEDNEAPLYELLGSEYILLFIDPKRKRVWVWYGIDTTIYMRVSAIKNAERIRDQHAFAFKVSGINEGFEPLGFRVFIGLEQEQDYTPEQIEPEYKGLEGEDELISHEQILLLLKKIDIPEGYERKIIIVNNEIYYYKEFEEIDSHVSTKRLFTLKEEVEDGSYLMEDYIPRLIFSFNKIKLIELLKKQDSI